MLPKKVATAGQIVRPSRRLSSRSDRPMVEPVEARRLFAATLAVVNPFNLPGSDRVIFNSIGNPSSGTPTNVFHSAQTLTLKNTGTSTLSISSLGLSGPFVFVTGSTTSTQLTNLSVAAGGSTSVVIQFTQASVPAHTVNETNYFTAVNSGAYVGGSMTIVSNDATTPNRIVGLDGYYQQVSNAGGEPSLQTIVNRVLGYQINLGINDDGSTTSLTGPKQSDVDLTEPSTSAQLYGSEVNPASWEAATAGGKVTIQELATFKTQGTISSTYFYAADSLASTFLYRTTAAQGQTILPTQNNAGQTPATSGGNPGLNASFTPTGAFGFRVDNEYSGDAVNVAKGNGAAGGHHFRFFPMIDSNGQAVANTYLMAMDYATSQAENFDFQDNVWVVSNIRPVATPDAPTNFTATNGAAPVLSWTASTASPVGYDVYRSATPNGTYTLLNVAPLTSTTYTDSALGSATATAYYQLKAVDSTQSPPAFSSAVSTIANAGPVVASPTYGVTAGTAFTFNALAGSSDATSTVSPSTVAITTLPGHGTATPDGAGNITYTATSTYAGADTLQYTVRDAAGVTSGAGTVTFNVSAAGSTGSGGSGNNGGGGQSTSPGTLVTNPFVGLTLENQTISLAVLGADTAATSFKASNPVALASSPSHGTATANADGTVTYVPSQGFVGSDTFTYKATDANGTVSAATAVAVNVGVAIGTGTPYRNLAFTDVDKTAVNVTLNRGTADVYFDSSSNAATTVKGSMITVTGTGLHIRTIGLSGTTTASTLTITGKGGGQVTFGGLYGTALGNLNAKTANLVTNGGSSAAAAGNPHPAGSITSDGIRNLTLRSAQSATIILGTGVPSTSVNFASTVDTTTLNSAAPINAFKAATYTGASFSSPATIDAPSIQTLTVPGEFDADLSLNAAPGRTSDLRAARLGTVANGSWVVAGNVGTVTIGSATAPATSPASFGGAAVAGGVTAFTVSRGNLAAGLAAATVGSFRVGGTFTGTLATTGNVNAVTVGALSGASVLVGTSATLATAAADTIGTATLRSLRVTGPGTVFNDSTVIAHTITSAVTGAVNAATANPEGIAAASIRSAVIGVNGAATVRLNAAALASQDALTAYLKSKSLTLGSFQLKIV